MTRQVWKQNQRDFRLITNHNRKKKKNLMRDLLIQIEIKYGGVLHCYLVRLCDQGKTGGPYGMIGCRHQRNDEDWTYLG